MYPYMLGYCVYHVCIFGEYFPTLTFFFYLPFDVKAQYGHRYI